MRPPTVPQFSYIVAGLAGIDCQIGRLQKSGNAEENRLSLIILRAEEGERQALSEKSKCQFVFPVTQRRGNFLKECLVAPVVFHDVLDSRGFALQAELRSGRENAPKPFLRQIPKRRLAAARSRQRDIGRE